MAAPRRGFVKIARKLARSVTQRHPALPVLGNYRLIDRVFAPEGRTAMANDKTNRGQPDHSKINMSEDYEVKLLDPPLRDHARGVTEGGRSGRQLRQSGSQRVWQRGRLAREQTAPVVVSASSIYGIDPAACVFSPEGAGLSILGRLSSSAACGYCVCSLVKSTARRSRVRRSAPDFAQSGSCWRQRYGPIGYAACLISILEQPDERPDDTAHEQHVRESQ